MEFARSLSQFAMVEMYPKSEITKFTNLPRQELFLAPAAEQQKFWWLVAAEVVALGVQLALVAAVEVEELFMQKDIQLWHHQLDIA
jgi:hypothetical protein